MNPAVNCYALCGNLSGNKRRWRDVKCIGINIAVKLSCHNQRFRYGNSAPDSYIFVDLRRISRRPCANPILSKHFNSLILRKIIFKQLCSFYFGSSIKSLYVSMSQDPLLRSFDGMSFAYKKDDLIAIRHFYQIFNAIRANYG